MRWFKRAILSAMFGSTILIVGILGMSVLTFGIPWLVIPAGLMIMVFSHFMAIVVYGDPLGGQDDSVDFETRCRKCRYILRGLKDPRCPECGEPI